MNIKSTTKPSRITHHASRITLHAPTLAARERRRGGLWWLAALLLALLAGISGPAFAQSGIPSIINYQGKLTDDLGRPVPAGSYQVTFKIWNVATSSPTDPGDYIWGRSLPVHVVTNGLFNVLLSDGALDGSPRVGTLLNAFDGEQRYLGLTITKTPGSDVQSPSEISPRQRLVSAPFAIHTYSAYMATWAAGATNAGLASTAQNAIFATNAGKFCYLSTNDFLLVNKTAQTLNGKLTATSFAGYGTIPVGGIILWQGNVDNIPDGWKLCNGLDGTPDLRDRFVVGAGSAYAVNDTGGTNFVTLSTNEMPAHSHGYLVRANAPDGGGVDKHYWQNVATNQTEVVGRGMPHENRPPYYALCYIVRVK